MALVLSRGEFDVQNTTIDPLAPSLQVLPSCIEFVSQTENNTRKGMDQGLETAQTYAFDSRIVSTSSFSPSAT